MPKSLNLAERASDRWTASSIICGVAEVGGFVAVVAAVGVVVVVVVVVVVWADPDRATGITPRTPALISLRSVLSFFIISSCMHYWPSSSGIAFRQDLRRRED